MSFLGGIINGIGGAIGGFASGGPIGAVAGGLSGLLGGGGGGRGSSAALPVNINPFANPFAGQPQTGGGMVPVPGVGGAVSRFLPGGQSGYTTRACLTKSGKMRRIRKDGKCWKRPTMNVLNPRAARRAIHRIKGARHLLHAIERELPRMKAHAKAKRSCGCK